MRPFLITGLPRSRTAWMALLTSTAPRTICHHEPSADTQSFEDLVALWREPGFDRVGMSDSTLGFQLERITKEIDPRILVIERPIAEVRGSMLKYLAGLDFSINRMDDYLAELSAALEFKHDDIARIPYADLKDRETLLFALAWILPDVEWPNLDSIMGMNVQVDRAYAMARASTPHSHWYRRAA